MKSNEGRLAEIYSYYLDERRKEDLSIGFADWLSQSMYAREIETVAALALENYDSNALDIGPLIGISKWWELKSLGSPDFVEVSIEIRGVNRRRPMYAQERIEQIRKKIMTGGAVDLVRASKLDHPYTVQDLINSFWLNDSNLWKDEEPLMLSVCGKPVEIVRLALNAWKRYIYEGVVENWQLGEFKLSRNGSEEVIIEYPPHYDDPLVFD